MARSRKQPAMNNRRLALVCCALSAILLVPGLFLPAVEMRPSFGLVVDELLRSTRSKWIDPQQYSIISGVWALLSDGDYVLGVIILLFSIVFPIVKLCVQAAKIKAAFSIEPSEKTENKWSKFVTIMANWSMLDVFVIAIMVIGFKKFPGGTVIHNQIGVYFFGASVLLLLISQYLLKQRTVL
jgi:paraquat-inducible protein A